MSTFGQPIYSDEEEKHGGVGNGPNGSASPSEAAQEEYIDPNDPLLTSEAVNDDVTADAYKIPPPAPDGYWNAKLKIVPIKDAKGAMVPFRTWKHPNMNDGKPMFVVNVEASLIDLSGKYDGTRLTEQWVKSNIERSGTSKMTTITQKAGGAVAKSSTDASRKDALLKALAGEPQVVVETVWEAQCMKCGEIADKKGEKKPGVFLRGQHRFPQVKNAQGKLEADPTIQCPVCKSPVRAQAKINRFFTIAEQPATQGKG